MITLEAIGISGALLVSIAWLIETIKVVNQHKRFKDLGFAFVYLVGTSLIFMYAFLIGNQVFAILEFIILSLVAFEILYTIVKICLCRYANIHINCYCAKFREK